MAIRELVCQDHDPGRRRRRFRDAREPELSLPVSCGETDTQRYTIDAHFDDGAAAECDATIPASDEPRDLEWAAEYWCRTTLVIERLTPAPQ